LIRQLRLPEDRAVLGASCWVLSEGFGGSLYRQWQFFFKPPQLFGYLNEHIAYGTLSIPATAPIVAAAAEQKNNNHDDQKRFHDLSLHKTFVA
jgi:hypothetical protein